MDATETDDISVALRSYRSRNEPPLFAEGDTDRDENECLESTEMDGDVILKLVEKRSSDILKRGLERYKRMFFPHLSQSSALENQDEEMGDSVSECALKIIMHSLKETGYGALAGQLEKRICGELDVCQRKLRQNLRKFEFIYEGAAQHGKRTLLSEVYIQLDITQGVSGTVNKEHEIRRLEAAAWRRVAEDKPIKCEDIFKPLRTQDGFIRTVLTTGISGIGKTISVHKFNLEWAEGRANQDIQLLINLPFRDLNLMTESYTLTQLLHCFLPEAEESGISNFGKYKLVLIFDGLDECRLPLDFAHNQPCRSVSDQVSVDVLLTSLIEGNLLPDAYIWITSRPAAASCIPCHLIDRVTEIQGFNNAQKDEYFRKIISDRNMASRVISHVKSTRSLHIMCHIPVFSWISASVLQRILRGTEMKSPEEDRGRNEIPKTLTQMYTYFMMYNSLIRARKYSAKEEAASTGQPREKIDEDLILKLGKLAFENLEKGNMIFYENELDECGIDVDAAAIHSGVFTQISGNDSGLHLQRVFSFVHLSMQEFFAAVYVFHTFTSSRRNLLEPEEPSNLQDAPGELTSLLKSAVDKALKSENGHLDLFLRFLLGLSQTSNSTLLNRVLPTMGSCSQRNEEIVEYIKGVISENPSAERCINLFQCLRELNDHSLVKEIESYLSSGRLSETELLPSQWSALVFVLLTSEEAMVEFDLKKYSRSEEGLLKLLPVIKQHSVALLQECNLTDKCCKALGDVLRDSCLKELDLSNNDLQDSGVQLLSAGLASPMCQLQKLRLSFCGVTEIGCDSLAKALSQNRTHLKELDLSYNHAGQRGTEVMSSVQKDVEQLTVSLDNNAECYLKSSLKKYACELTMDVNSAHSHLLLSEDNQKMTRMEAAQTYPDNPERFTDWGQVLCREGLSARHYWEVEWTGEWTRVGVAYKGISRKAKDNDSVIGCNDQSWGLRYHGGTYTAWFNKNDAAILTPYFSSKRVGVYLDWWAGTLSFYALSSHTMTHLYTFHTRFSEPLYPGFRLGSKDSSLALCRPQ